MPAELTDEEKRKAVLFMALVRGAIAEVYPGDPQAPADLLVVLAMQHLEKHGSREAASSHLAACVRNLSEGPGRPSS